MNCANKTVERIFALDSEPEQPATTSNTKKNKSTIAHNRPLWAGFHRQGAKGMSGQEPSNEDEHDARLMMRMKEARDENALRELIERYRGPVYTMAYRMLGNAADAEDIAQRTFIRVWKASAEYKPEARFTTWLFTIVRNLVFNESRRRRRKPVNSLESGAEHGFYAEAPAEQAPDAHLEHKELEVIVEKALSKLAPKARMAVQLRRFENMGYEDIASILGMTASATKSLLFRARRELKELLSDYL